LCGSNGLLRDLHHPNEYIRGCTLRFLCKLKESELLEPLIPAIRQNLEHRHSYVRRNAVLCVYSIYKDFARLIPDAPDLILEFLKNEGDPSCRRNAFIMLFNTAQEKAVQYLNTVLDEVLSFGEILQLIVIEMIKKMWRLESRANRVRYIRTLFALLGARTRSSGRVGGTNVTGASGISAAVQYEAALCLVQLSTAPTALREATLALIHLLCTESDHNVKLVVLDRLVDIKTRYRKVLQELVMDILRALSTPNLELRHKTLGLALDLVTPHNVSEVVQLLKKEVHKTQQLDQETAGKVDADTAKYRHLLIHAIHQCAVKFPDIANEVVHVLMDFLTDGREDGSVDESAQDVIAFVRDVVETYPPLRAGILNKLLHESLGRIQHEEVYRAALWIISEYAESKADVDAALQAIHAALGELPLVSAPTPSSEESVAANASDTAATNANVSSGRPAAASSPPVTSPRTLGPRVLPDGTYATETALSLMAAGSHKMVRGPLRAGSSSLSPLRRLLLATRSETQQRTRGLLAGVVGVSLLKLTLRALTLLGTDSSPQHHQLVARTLHTLTCLRQLPELESDNDTRLAQCILILLYSHRYGVARRLYLDSLTRLAFAEALAETHQKRAAETAASLAQSAQQEREQSLEHPDTLIRFRHLRSTRTLLHDFETDGDDEVDDSLRKVRGSDETAEDHTQRLQRIVQLTGFSDPLYAEAYVHVHQYDIVLDMTVINQTGDTLQGVTLELATLGDLKLCERPQSFNLAPYGTLNLKSSIKVSSTETGLIFGSIAYDVAGQVTDKRNYVVLNEIRIDIVDYITPATCSDAAFRNMWSEFEWENKVSIHTNFDNLNEFLEHILKTTNMRSLTPKYEDNCFFLSANLYAKSIFGEDALANVSAEKHPDGKISGFIRIRSKTQGLAISLGDKINQNLKRPPK
jgi:coatomer subunit beta